MSAQGQIIGQGQAANTAKQAIEREPNPYRDAIENLEQLAANFGEISIRQSKRNNRDEIAVRAGDITTHGHSLYRAVKQRVEITAAMVTQGIGAGENDAGGAGIDQSAKVVGAQAMSGMTPRRVP